MRKSYALVLVVMVLAASVAMADPYMSVWGVDTPATRVNNSWIGSSGMIMTPVAKTVAPQAGIWTVHYIDYDAGKVQSANVNFGITPSLEVGAAYIDVDGDGSEVVANAKYSLDLAKWTGNEDAPEVAIGAWDIANEFNRSFYVVLSQDVRLKESGDTSNFRLHLGYGDNDLDGGALDGFFGGIEFIPFERGLIQLEHDGENLNAAFNYYISDTVGLQIGSLDGDLGAGISLHTGF